MFKKSFAQKSGGPPTEVKIIRYLQNFYNFIIISELFICIEYIYIICKYETRVPGSIHHQSALLKIKKKKEY